MTTYRATKSRVLARWPSAFPHQWADCWSIYDGGAYFGFGNTEIGRGRTRAEAWAKADKRKGKQRWKGK